MLYGSTPTYGPEEDWLRAALDALVASGVLEPLQPTTTTASYDVDSVLAFAGEAVKEHLQTRVDRPASRGVEEEEVLALDYASHVHAMAGVKAMFAPHRAGDTSTPATVPRPPPTSTSRSRSAKSAGTGGGGHGRLASYKFLGLRISPSPAAYAAASQRQQRWNGGPHRCSYERQDDPYGGLM